MKLFLIFSAMMAAVLFIAQFFLKRIEEQDRRAGCYESSKRYTIWGIFCETIKENIKFYTSKIKKKKPS